MSLKLIDDCFRTDPRDKGRMTHDATLAMIRARVATVVAQRRFALADALGRIAAEDIMAPISVPGHTNSAVDGYAFAHTNTTTGAAPTTGELRFDVAARIAAGPGRPVTLAPGQAARIFTGAVMPTGADTVVMQEDCAIEHDGATVVIPGGLKAGANVRRAGEDVAAGSTVLRRGETVRAPDVAALASLGVDALACYERPRIGIIATGDEIVRGAAALQPGQVYDVNTPLLLALARHSAGHVTDAGLWPDRRQAVVEQLAKAADTFDLVITSGGASQGEEDHISGALAELGSRHFWQIAVKPGRPLMLGQIGSTIVVGLPGNPVAVFVCFLIYVWPMIRALGGAEWREPRRFPLPADFEFADRKVGRREFWRGTTRTMPSGLVVDKFPRDGSGLISGLRAADGLIDVPEHVPSIERGQLVDFIPYSEFGILD